eukprot:COSAG02_NODE_13_length_57813_cov_14.298276_35_plen_329_part_00
MLRTSVCLLAGARMGAAQGSLSDDVTVLLAFKAHGNNAQVDGLDTWVSGGDPNSGFAHVMCCDAYTLDESTYDYVCTGSNAHRVTYLNLYGTGTAVDGDVSGLAGLAQLTYLHLGGTAVDGDVSGLGGLAQLTYLSLFGTAVDGDVSGLGGLAQLTYLRLDYTAVDGDVSGLGGLTQLTYLRLDYTAVDGDVSGLGGLAQLTYLNLDYTAVDGDVSGLGGLAQLTYLNLFGTAVDGDVSGLGGLTQLTSLYLDGTGCYGDSSLLPSSVSSYSLQHHLDYCSSSHDACPAGRTPVSIPDTYVGSNACACCSGTQKLLDSGTGACVDPGA